MEQTERLDELIAYLISEEPRYSGNPFPEAIEDKKRIFRALVNIRPPRPVSEDFLEIQDEYLKEEISSAGITDIDDLTPVKDNLYVWQGDITTLRADAIVNAANSDMLGCFAPCHACIDNCIHTFAGVQLRLACNELMVKQGRKEETGTAKITPAFNLPSKYVIHTVGPIVSGGLTKLHEELLASSYRSCLELADKYGCENVVFCCISTGVFKFPNQRAAEIAVETVNKYLENAKSVKRVVFNVFKDLDRDIYLKLLTN